MENIAMLPKPVDVKVAVRGSVPSDADAVAVIMTKGSTPTDLPEGIATTVAALVKAGMATGKAGEAVVQLLDGHKPGRLLVIGLGKAKTLSVDEVRKGAGTAVRAAKPRALKEISIAFPEDHALSDEHLETLPCDLTARWLVEGAEIAEPDWDTYRSERKDLSVATLTVIAKDGEKSTKEEIEKGVEEGLIVARAQNFARSLVNEPGNVLTPTELARRAKAMCVEMGIACETYGMEKLDELKMGAFRAVAQGSAEAPALIVMTYTPEGGTADGAPVMGLVGKGITFDTGGISIKPADNMEKMKYDMAGSAAMIGAMRAIAELKPKVKVIGVVCSAENMPDGKAFKPGDVVTAMSGKTIEIINTDAEGRLVLADGLHYAKTLGCTHLVDAATLTGACVVALGYNNVGLFSNDEETWAAFMAGVKKSGEKFWRLPCTEDYREQIKSQIGDIMNSGGRAAGAVTAAMFLKEFAGETPWIHLDIAGMAWNEETKPWLPKGPTGVAVRSIVEWVRGYGE